MHELSMASNILEAVLEVASRYGAKKVLEVNIDVGELTLLNPDQLMVAFSVLSKGTIVEGAKLNINTVKAMARCNRCGEEWESNVYSKALYIDHLIVATNLDHNLRAFFKETCPKCGESDFEFIAGNEFLISRIKIEK
ncbi:MAG: hydrogenase maturation nickel metallochaperone HypA [Candidatus Nezhaarchaeales archaeon]